MNKDELQKECTKLGIKFQDNDTNENLQLMIAGKMSSEILAEKDSEIKSLGDQIAELEAQNKQLSDSMNELVEANSNLEETVKTGKLINRFKFGKVEYCLKGKVLNIPAKLVGDENIFEGGKISIKDALNNKELLAILVEKGIAQKVES